MDHDIVNTFTSHLKDVLTRALCCALEEKETHVAPRHFLWALGTQKGSVGAEVLRKTSIKPTAWRGLRHEVKQRLPEKIIPSSSPLLSPEAQRIIERAVLTASLYEHAYVGTEHLLSGILESRDEFIHHFFTRHHIQEDLLREQLRFVLKSTSRFPELTASLHKAESEEKSSSFFEDAEELIDEEEDQDIPSSSSGRKTPALDYFGRDLTHTDIEVRLDPVIGRSEELNRLMEILCRRTKNNPLLLGEPGVGKTALVEGLAKCIRSEDVPPALQKKRVIALDLALLIAGTMYRGEFEGRLRQLIEEVSNDPNIILFIDEIHTIIGAGSASGSLDAAHILKPALARGQIRCIGATTPAEFKKYIEADTALERRFQPLWLREPNSEETLTILRGIAKTYGTYHHVQFSEEALKTAVDLSIRYLPEKRLPDKAIDLIDEAAAACRVHTRLVSPEDRHRLMRHRLIILEEQKRQAILHEQFPEAIRLKEEEMQLRRELETSSSPSEIQPLSPIIPEHIIRVVAQLTRTPVEELLDDTARLKLLEERLKKEIVGQDAAVTKAASLIRRAHMGLKRPNRPLASLLFVGPSGVGKTALAKALAEGLSADKRALVRFDMSEYAESFGISKLIGAPAGYVGYREGARLTDVVRQKPYTVLLFDECEKAHRDVQNLLLQILEEGELTDATGRLVSFRQTIIILTSNVGMERFDQEQIGFHSDALGRQTALLADIRTDLEERFRPELLNRLDDICLFTSLTESDMEAIALKELHLLKDRLKKQTVSLNFRPSVIAMHLAHEAITKKTGARGIHRLIEQSIESPLADLLLRDSSKKTYRLSIDHDTIRVM